MRADPEFEKRRFVDGSGGWKSPVGYTDKAAVGGPRDFVFRSW